MRYFLFRKVLMAGIIVIGFLTAVDMAQANEYVIGAEDILKISFWQDSQLNQEVTVRQDGKITLSIIGEITAAGLTSLNLAEKIEKRVSLYNKKISQATVTVIEFNSQKLFVSGQVNTPGKKTFEVIPDIWTVIKEAGGTTEIGDLARVSIIRSRESGGEIITVNVLDAIATGRLDELPKLKSGDTIEIPKMAGGVPGRQLATDYAERRYLYYVIGQVTAPGVRPYEQGIDIFDAIGAAGGTTEAADLSSVRIISKNMDGSTSIKVDLKKYQSEGRARRIVIKPEDMIIVGTRKGSLLSWGTVRDFMAIAGTVVSFVYLIDRR